MPPLSEASWMTANSLIMLSIRAIWMERNAHVFDGILSPADRVLGGVVEEWRSWVSCKRGLIDGIG